MSIKSIYNDVKEWNRKFHERMSKPVDLPTIDHTHHICNHCGYGFDGRCCPQCGMPSGQYRFTFKQLIHNFLDIWGMGNRPMFRSMRDLLLRPGYMIRDYLGGHHLSYFPPFKMLAVLTIFIVFLSWIFNFHDPLVGKKIAEEIHKSHQVLQLSETTHSIFDYIENLIIYLDKNDLYRILFQNIFVVLAAWIVFRKKGYNLVETFFSQIYINCQFHLLTLIWMLIIWDLPPTVLLPYYVPGGIAFSVLVFDYRQLYGLKWMSSIWRTVLFILLTFAIYVLVILLLVIVLLIIENMTGSVPLFD